MNDIQENVMEVLGATQSPDVDYANKLLKMCKAAELPYRVTNAIEDYMQEKREAIAAKTVADQLAKRASETWSGIREGANKRDDLVSQADEITRTVTPTAQTIPYGAPEADDEPLVDQETAFRELIAAAAGRRVCIVRKKNNEEIVGCLHDSIGPGNVKFKIHVDGKARQVAFDDVLSFRTLEDETIKLEGVEEETENAASEALAQEILAKLDPEDREDATFFQNALHADTAEFRRRVKKASVDAIRAGLRLLCEEISPDSTELLKSVEPDELLRYQLLLHEAHDIYAEHNRHDEMRAIEALPNVRLYREETGTVCPYLTEAPAAAEEPTPAPESHPAPVMVGDDSGLTPADMHELLVLARKAYGNLKVIGLSSSGPAKITLQKFIDLMEFEELDQANAMVLEVLAEMSKRRELPLEIQDGVEVFYKKLNILQGDPAEASQG